MRKVHEFAAQRGYRAFPNFEYSSKKQGVYYINPSCADVKTVSNSELGSPTWVNHVFRGTHRYAVTHGYVGGFPTYRNVPRGKREVVLIKQGCADLKYVYRNIYIAHEAWTRDKQAYSWSEFYRDIMGAAIRSFNDLASCQSSATFTSSEINSVLAAFRKPLVWQDNFCKGSSSPLGCAEVGGTLIHVNLDRRTPAGLAGTISHEMAHIAGYRHSTGEPGAAKQCSGVSNGSRRPAALSDDEEFEGDTVEQGPSDIWTLVVGIVAVAAVLVSMAMTIYIAVVKRRQTAAGAANKLNEPVAMETLEDVPDVVVT